MCPQTQGQRDYNQARKERSIPERILGLLEATNGGVVTYRLIEAVCWPGTAPPERYHYFVSLIRSRTGKGVAHHTGIGYRREPALDQSWASDS